MADDIFESLLSDPELGTEIAELMRRKRRRGITEPLLPGISLLAGQIGFPLAAGMIGRMNVVRPQRWVAYSVDVWPEGGTLKLAVWHAPLPTPGSPRNLTDAMGGDTIDVTANGLAWGDAQRDWTRLWKRMDLLEVLASDVVGVEQVLITFYTIATPRAAFAHVPYPPGAVLDSNGNLITTGDGNPVVAG